MATPPKTHRDTAGLNNEADWLAPQRSVTGPRQAATASGEYVPRDFAQTGVGVVIVQKKGKH